MPKTVEEWLEWATEHDYPPEIIAFVRDNPEAEMKNRVTLKIPEDNIRLAREFHIFNDNERAGRVLLSMTGDAFQGHKSIGWANIASRLTIDEALGLVNMILGEVARLRSTAATVTVQRLCNTYRCDDCDQGWSDVWCCACDDDCPGCGDSHSPTDSGELEEFELRPGVDICVVCGSTH